MLISTRPSRTAFWLGLLLLSLTECTLAQSAPPSSPLATTTVLHSFTIENFGNTDNIDGIAFPGPLILGSDNNFYGVAQSGGQNGTGTVFQATRTGIVTVLLAFDSGNVNTSGSAPGGPLIEDPASPGTFYGTTRSGGDHASGTIFKLTTTGGTVTETVLHSFGDPGTPNDGIIPAGALAISGGVLYGTTRGGGANGNAGTVYAFNTTSSAYAIRHNFTAATDGSNPNGLVLNGTTLSGIAQFGGQFGAGTVWTLATNGSGFNPLYTFGGADGYAKPALSLAVAPNGTRYGSFGVGTPSGYGGIFQISPQGAFSVLHAFVYDFFTLLEGGWAGPVTLGLDGNLYGQLGQTPFNTPSNQFNPSFDHRHFEVSTTDGSLTLLSGPSPEIFAGYGTTPLTSETALTVAPDGAFYALENTAGATGYGDIVQLRPAPPNVLTVSSTGDNAGDPATLRGAISAAQPGDAIVFSDALQSAPSTITLTQGELVISRDLDIVYTPEQVGSSLTIDANDQSRVCHISGGIVNLSGLTLAHGSVSDHGGGVLIDGSAAAQLSSLTIMGCSATGSRTSEGGGLCLASGDVVFSGAVANCMSTLGGGIAIDTGPVITGSPLPGGALLRFFTLDTNKAMEGGGLGIQGGGPIGAYFGTLTNDQAGDNGGGIFDSGGQLVLENSTLSADTANGVTLAAGAFSPFASSGSGGGGGLYNVSGSEVLQDDVFSGDTAYTGGALDVSLDPTTGPGYTKIYFTTFSGNSAVSSQGGLNNPGPLNGDGGAITVDGGHLDLLQSTIGGDASQNTAGNHADTDGGGIYVGSGNADFANSGLMTINDVTLYGNDATGLGGGVFNADPNTSNVSMRYSTVTNNNAPAGGGLYQAAGANPFTVTSTIIAQNTLGGSGATATGQDALAAPGGTFATGGSNLIGNGAGATGFTNGTNSDQVGSGNSVIDPLLFPFGNYGGTTLTRALEPGSPALHASFNIDNSLDLFDQRGVQRPYPSAFDIGAAEHPSPHALADSYAATENTELDIAAASGVLANDYADDGETPNPYPLTAVVNSTTANGILTLNTNGSFSYVPNNGFTGSDSFTYIARDPIAGSISATVTIFVTGASANPTTTATVSGTGGNNGYYRSDVTVTLTATDPNYASNSLTTTYSVDSSAQTAYTTPFLVTGPGTHTVTFFSSDPGGNTEAPQTLTIKIDATPPTATFGSPSPAPNALGFNNSPVTVPYTTADATSGVASATPGSPLTFTTEGANQVRAVTVTDNAGNTATFTSPPVSIDLTPPVTAATTQGAPGGRQVTLAASDNLSGVASTAYALDGGMSQPYTGPFTVTGVGTHTVTYHSADKAGNVEAPQTFSFSVSASAPYTTATLSGTTGQNGFYRSPVTVTLTGTDPQDATGVAATFYRIDSGPQQTYTGPFTVSGDFNHLVTFYSVGHGGLAESPNSGVTFSIDATQPVTTITAADAPGGKQVTLTDRDNFSGPGGTFYRIDSGPQRTYAGPFLVSGNYDHLVTAFSIDRAGNAENPNKSLAFTLSPPPPSSTDTTPPVTTVALSGSPFFNGYYHGPVTLTLSAADSQSGIAGTFYRVDSGPQQTYTGPFQVTGDFTHLITFYSTDRAGNAESPNGSASFSIDSTPPVTTITAADAPGGKQVTLKNTDNFSGPGGTFYRVDSGPQQTYTGPFTVTGDFQHLVTAYSVDRAGNAENPNKSLSFTLTPPPLPASADTTPPVTTAVVSSPFGTKGGVFRQLATVTLSATDSQSGVAGTFYRVDGGPQQTYTGTFTVSGFGSHTVTFFSTDIADNAEAPAKSVTFTIVR